jgi:hypothetical protein
MSELRVNLTFDPVTSRPIIDLHVSCRSDTAMVVALLAAAGFACWWFKPR